MEEKLQKCKICYENFNLLDKVPKMMECCPKSFCLKCLVDIHKRKNGKIVCPICRYENNKHPNDLKVNKEMLEVKPSCPQCGKNIRISEMKIYLKEDKVPKIMCSKCAIGDDYHNLFHFVDNFTEETKFFCDTFFKCDKEIFKFTINNNVNDYVENVCLKIKEKLSVVMKDFIKETFINKFNFDYNNDDLFSDFSNLKSQCMKMNQIKQLKTEDFGNIINAFELYHSKGEEIRIKAGRLNKMYKYLEEKQYISDFGAYMEQRMLNIIRIDKIEEFDLNVGLQTSNQCNINDVAMLSSLL